MFCPKCGNEMADSDRFCTQCGYDAQTRPQEPDTAPDDESEQIRNQKPAGEPEAQPGQPRHMREAPAYTYDNGESATTQPQAQPAQPVQPQQPAAQAPQPGAPVPPTYAQAVAQTKPDDPDKPRRMKYLWGGVGIGVAATLLVCSLGKVNFGPTPTAPKQTAPISQKKNGNSNGSGKDQFDDPFFQNDPFDGFYGDDDGNGGSVHRKGSYLGVMVEDGDGGAKVVEVKDGSPAASAGIQKYDVITKVGDTQIDSAQKLTEVIRDSSGTVKVTLKRNGEEKTVDVSLAYVEVERHSYSFSSPNGRDGNDSKSGNDNNDGKNGSDNNDEQNKDDDGQNKDGNRGVAPFDSDETISG